METCDVLIVGGGPAGSTCAWQLGRAGLDVMVMDTAAFPRDKVCAGWITLQVVDDLRLDVAAPKKSRPTTATRSASGSAAASSTTTCFSVRARAWNWARP